jgi:hypothetical protein
LTSFEKRFIKIAANITIGINNGYMYQLRAKSRGLYSLNEVVKAIIKITVPQNQKDIIGCSFFLELKKD